MTISAAIHHVTRYRYDRPVALGAADHAPAPAPHCRAKIVAYALKVSLRTISSTGSRIPTPIGWRASWFRKSDGIQVEVDLTAEHAVINPFDFFLEPYAEQFPFAYVPELKAELEPYLDAEPVGPALRPISRLCQRADPHVNFLVDLNTALQKAIRYLIRMEPGIQTPEETLVQDSGSCRDSAWALVQMLRHLGLAARFVSGYLIQLRPTSSRSTGRGH